LPTGRAHRCRRTRGAPPPHPKPSGLERDVGVLVSRGGSEQAFQFVELTVDGRRRPVRRTTRTGAQIFTVSLGDDVAIAKHRLTISYTYRVLIQQQGHLLHFDISRPTKGLRVELAYGGCDIRRVNVVDYIASSRQPGLTRLPPSEPTPSVTLSFDGWILPKAGVAFVWVLEREMASAVASRARV
jgi:hypothetical protein